MKMNLLRIMLTGALGGTVTDPGTSGSSDAGGLSVESITSVDSINDGGALSDVSDLVDSYGGGTYNIVFKVGVWALLIGMAVAAIVLIFSGANNRHDAKVSIICKVLGGLLLFGVIGIAVFLQKVGMGLFG